VGAPCGFNGVGIVAMVAAAKNVLSRLYVDPLVLSEMLHVIDPRDPLSRPFIEVECGQGIAHVAFLSRKIPAIAIKHASLRPLSRTRTKRWA
jgi:hypothetical protein